MYIDNKNSQSLILLTYKGKVLLMYKMDSPIDDEKHPWCFISVVREKKEPFEYALSRKVENEMGIKIDNVEFVSECCYHARLTDDNVNQIKRTEGKLLDFFTLKEIRKLRLSEPTKEYVTKHAHLM